MTFYPTTIDLPLMPGRQFDENEGFLTTFELAGVFEHFTEYVYLSEFPYVNFGYYNDLSDLLGELRVGDIAYARVRLGNIKLIGRSIEASLEDVEVLSDVLAHDEER